MAGWWLVALGAACVGAPHGSTPEGPRPYGYVGLGEVSVFVFFGLVATTGTAYVQTEVLTSLEVLAALPVGLMAVALLVVNNLRDIPGTRPPASGRSLYASAPPLPGALYEGCVAPGRPAGRPDSRHPALGLARPGCLPRGPRPGPGRGFRGGRPGSDPGPRAPPGGRS